MQNVILLVDLQPLNELDNDEAHSAEKFAMNG